MFKLTKRFSIRNYTDKVNYNRHKFIIVKFYLKEMRINFSSL